METLVLGIIQALALTLALVLDAHKRHEADAHRLVTRRLRRWTA